MQAAGCQLMTGFGAACELRCDRRNDIKGLGALFSNHLPSYRCLITVIWPAKMQLTNEANKEVEATAWKRPRLASALQKLGATSFH
jgi:hypothetical protein